MCLQISFSSFVFPFASCFFIIFSRSSHDETNGRYRWLSLSGISNELDWLSFAFYSNRRGWRKSPGATETDSLIALRLASNCASHSVRFTNRAKTPAKWNPWEKSTETQRRKRKKEEFWYRRGSGEKIKEHLSVVNFRQSLFHRKWRRTFRGRERDLAKYDWKSCNEVSDCDIRN